MVFNVEKNIAAVGSTAMEMIQRASGIVLSDGKITMQGKLGVTILVDGKPSVLDLSNFPAENIERIEFIFNPSAQYAASGKGGIINILLNDIKQMVSVSL